MEVVGEENGQPMPRRRDFIKGVFGAAVAVSMAAGADSAAMAASGSGSISHANKTLFGENVYVFDPKMPSDGINHITQHVFQKMESNQFAAKGYAFLFKPGQYSVNFNVGFYTEVAGLGQNPDDVQINGGVNINAQWSGGSALDNFWRSISNIAVQPSATGGTARIAVSQAAPIRRLHVKGGLNLFDVWKSCQWWLPRRFHRGRQSPAGLAAAMVVAKQQVGRLEQRRLEHGLCRVPERARKHLSKPGIHRGRGNTGDTRKALPDGR
jgi:hypothetical protein